MKRAATGGAHRGPVAPQRQRRTIRFVQILLMAITLGLIAFGVFSFAERTAAQAIVVLIVGALAGGAGYLLSDGPSVRVPTPARLDELAGRAERVALEKAAD